MSSGDIFCPYPLEHESDFDKIVSSDGLVSVCGFGSLLSGPYSCFNLAFVMAVTFLFCREYSVFAYFDDYVVGRAERSARSTFPELINFRIGKLSGFRRVFAHVAPIFFERGIAKPETKVSVLHFTCSVLVRGTNACFLAIKLIMQVWYCGLHFMLLVC